jgi:hypothetical protein
MATSREPRGRARAVGERSERVAGGQHLVDVVQEGRGLDERAVHRVPGGDGAKRQPPGDLRDRPDVAKMPRRWLDRQEESGGVDAPGNRHLPDHT